MVYERVAECVNKAEAQFRDAILPIYGSTENGSPDQIG
jgi:hypothetical protein